MSQLLSGSPLAVVRRIFCEQSNAKIRSYNRTKRRSCRCHCLRKPLGQARLAVQSVVEQPAEQGISVAVTIERKEQPVTVVGRGETPAIAIADAVQKYLSERSLNCAIEVLNSTGQAVGAHEVSSVIVQCEPDGYRYHRSARADAGLKAIANAICGAVNAFLIGRRPVPIA